MNESQIERLMLSLKPVSPSPQLMERVEHDMQLQSFFRMEAPAAAASPKQAQRRSWHVPVAWASVGAAAAALVVSLMPPREVSAPAATMASRSIPVGNAAQMAPVSTNAVAPVGQVVSAQEVGIIQPTSGQPTRQIRVQRIIQQVVIDPSTGAQAIIERPVEEIIEVPVQVQ
jgi:hypothetical protein